MELSQLQDLSKGTSGKGTLRSGDLQHSYDASHTLRNSPKREMPARRIGLAGMMARRLYARITRVSASVLTYKQSSDSGWKQQSCRLTLRRIAYRSAMSCGARVQGGKQAVWAIAAFRRHHGTQPA
eukprot:5951706-Amphidinium_carterae.2